MSYHKYVRITRWNPQTEFLHCKNCGYCLDNESNVWDDCSNCSEKDRSTPISESLEFDFKNSEDQNVRAEAAYRLGCFHYDRSGNGLLEIGISLMNNTYQAIFWFQNAAFLGHLEAMYRLARIYSECETELDISTALAYIDKINERKNEVVPRGKRLLEKLENDCREKLNEIRVNLGKLPFKIHD